MKRVGLILAAMASAAGAQTAPLIGPWPVDDPTQVLVLGSPHLSGIEHLKQDWMAPLLDRLAAWGPRIITIEGLSGPECFLLRRYEKTWPGTADDYCARVEKVAALGKASTGLDMPEAEAAAETMVAKLSPASSSAEHRRMAAVFAAAGNLGSAATQWLRLKTGERRPGDGVDAALAQALDELSARRNENYWIAAALAARLGLERVYPTDDHLADEAQVEEAPGQDRAMPAIWDSVRPPLARKGQAMETALKDGGTVLAYYRFMNRADVGAEAVRADMGKGHADMSPQRYGRRYVAWWEARNLYMVGNIRRALRRAPGSRALVIVGSTHKPYFDAYLGMMHEIRLVPAEQVLGK